MLKPVRILHVTAEVQPLIKTGGLADVLGSLPMAQRALGHSLVVLVPGYPAVLRAAGPLETLAGIDGGRIGAGLLRGQLAGGVELWIIDHADLYQRPGGPYADPQGRAWPDNHVRFATLGRVAAALCAQFEDIDLLHAHDWHAGLAPAYLRAAGTDCASCFTIHNLAYQGRYGSAQFAATGLPGAFYRFDGLEYYGDWSFMKAALSYSDVITTVSPTYAREILKPGAGMGLHTLLDYRRRDLHGILNGVDYDVWDPATDEALERRYSARALGGKRVNKAGLQRSLGLEPDPERLLLAIVSRFTAQKGLDYAFEALVPMVAAGRLQLAVLGNGDPALEAAYRQLAQACPQNCALSIGYDEQRAHRIFGGADAILVPSRFEPCGLTQMYGLRYGTLPIVRNTGGLADTVVGYRRGGDDAATGFVFHKPSAPALGRALKQALKLYREPAQWTALMRNAMRCEFGWDRAAQAYLDLYRDVIARRASGP